MIRWAPFLEYADNGTGKGSRFCLHGAVIYDIVCVDIMVQIYVKHGELAQLGTRLPAVHSKKGFDMMKYNVRLIWDDEAQVWYTGESDIPGLGLEAETFDALVEEVRIAAPIMLELNSRYEGPIYLIFETVRIETAKVS